MGNETLACTRRGSKMRTISVILDPAAIKTILGHLRQKKPRTPGERHGRAYFSKPRPDSSGPHSTPGSG